MSVVFCHYHTDQRAEFTCTKCQKPICSGCKHDDLCTICHYSVSSYVKTIAGFIGITLFFLPFFGGAAMLIAAIINSGFFWFLILFAIAWIGGVAVSYTSILGSFIKSMIDIRKERHARREFRVQMGVDKHGNRISPYVGFPSKSEVAREILYLPQVESHHSVTLQTVQTVQTPIKVSPECFAPFSHSIPDDYVFCYKCGKVLPADALFCLQCGVPLNYKRLQE